MIVCHCKGITDRQIRRVVRDGLTSVHEVARATGASLRCGGCRPNFLAVAGQAVEREQARTQSGTSFLGMALPVES